MENNTAIARRALKGALKVRKMIQSNIADPICSIDVPKVLGLELRFINAPTLEGMYAKASKAIVLSSLRPSGRRAFTCSHEIGHWFFKHGDCVDETNAVEKAFSKPEKEKLADLFAGYFLMPPWALKKAFEERGFNISKPTTVQAYTIACQFGVGYASLINHLQWTLHKIDKNQADKLLKIQPKEIRKEILGFEMPETLLVVDHFWNTIAIDLQVNDAAILPKESTVEGECLRKIPHENGLIIYGISQGIGRIETKKYSAFVRISKRDFIGRCEYRHLEDPEDE